MKQREVRGCWWLCLMAAVLFFAGCPTDSGTDSDPVVVVDAEKPVISVQPKENSSYVKDAEAEDLSVTAEVKDEGTLSYQWFKNGTPISDGNKASYTPSTDSLGDFGYHVEVTNTNAAVNGVKTVTIRSAGARVVISETPIIIWSVKADGEVDKTTSTTLTFTFSSGVTGLTAEDITLANAQVTPGTLAGPDGEGTTWTLALSEVTAQEQLTVSITKAGIETGSKQVAVYKALSNPQVAFMNIDNQGYGATEISPSGTDPDEWVLNAIDQREAYFGVYKTVTQIIGVTGKDAAKVRVVNSNDTINGELVQINSINVGNDPRYVVYQVDTSSFDLLFDGGSLEFKLEVREGAAPVREVPVTLKVTPTIIKDSITIFSVTRTPAQTGDEEGSLTKINATLEVEGNPVRVNTLFEAFQWIDTKTVDDNIEYLIRVEKDDQIPRVVLSCSAKDATIRLRGYEKERKITWDGTNAIYSKDMSGYYTSLINIGVESSDSKGVTLQLEQDITLDGEKKITSIDSNAINYDVYGMITVYKDDTLIMKSGSKLTGYVYPGSNYDGFYEMNPIVVYHNNTGFILDGGEITGNTVAEGVICAPDVHTDGDWENVYGELFVYISGKINDNTRADESTHGNYIVSYNSNYLKPVDITHN